MLKHAPRPASPELVDAKGGKKTRTSLDDTSRHTETMKSAGKVARTSTPVVEAYGVTHVPPRIKSPRPSTPALSSNASSSKQRKLSKRFEGPIYMLLSTGAFWIMSVAVKALYPWQSYETIAVRSMAGLGYCLFYTSGHYFPSDAGLVGGLWAKDPKSRSIRPSELQWKLLLRATLGFLSLWTQCLSLERLTVGESTVLQYLYPLLGLWLAAVLISEPYTAFDVFMSGLGLVGCGLVVLPARNGATGLEEEDIDLAGSAGVNAITVGILAGLASALFQALSYISVRQVARQAHALQLLFYFSLICLPCAVLARAIFEPVPLKELQYFPTSFSQLWWLAVVCVSGVVGQIALSNALRTERVGDAASLSYLQVPLAYLADFLFFGTQSTMLSIIGALLITVCGLLPSVLPSLKEKFNSWYRSSFGKSTLTELKS